MRYFLVFIEVLCLFVLLSESMILARDQNLEQCEDDEEPPRFLNIDGGDDEDNDGKAIFSRNV